MSSTIRVTAVEPSFVVTLAESGTRRKKSSLVDKTGLTYPAVCLFGTILGQAGPVIPYDYFVVLTGQDQRQVGTRLVKLLVMVSWSERKHGC